MNTLHVIVCGDPTKQHDDLNQKQHDDPNQKQHDDFNQNLHIYHSHWCSHIMMYHMVYAET